MPVKEGDSPPPRASAHFDVGGYGALANYTARVRRLAGGLWSQTPMVVRRSWHTDFTATYSGPGSRGPPHMAVAKDFALQLTL